MNPIDTIDLEKQILGSIIYEGQYINEVKNPLNRENFSLLDHKILFELLVDMYDCNIPIDVVTVKEYIKEKNIKFNNQETTCLITTLVDPLITDIVSSPEFAT